MLDQVIQILLMLIGFCTVFYLCLCFTTYILEILTKKEANKMKSENDIKYHLTDGIPDEMIKAQEDSCKKAADILDNYATKLSRSDDIASGRMSVAEYEDLITAIRYAISYLRGGSK